VEFIENCLAKFESALFEYGLGTIAEIYDGNPPHKPNGCFSQAWSVAEILRVKKLVEHYKNTAL